jgi:hypothetical protein
MVVQYRTGSPLDYEQQSKNQQNISKKRESTMNKNHIVRNTFLSIVFALFTIVLLVPVASAHTTPTTHETANSVTQTNLPSVNIVTVNGSAVFSSPTIHCKAQGLQTPCFTISNTTNATQVLLFKGTALLTIPSGYIGNISLSGAGVAFFRLQSNPQTQLTAIAS